MLKPKLIIQIPCFNEEKTLPVTLKDLPRQIEGIGKVEWLVINDGSTDKTIDVAKAFGVDHIVNIKKNQGLAGAFWAGLEACLNNGADIIVNTDADNQYNAQDIPNLLKPILEGKADIVVGARPIDSINHFSSIKKILQKVGSWVVKTVSNTDIPDAPCGFRAFSRDAAMRINVFSNYTYTLETIIQAGQKRMFITWVPISVNAELRPSRLFNNLLVYLYKSTSTIGRIFVVYKSFRFFMTIGAGLFIGGVMIGIRFLFYYFFGDGSGHVQSLILASILTGVGFQTMLTAFLADLLSVNRKLMEDLQYRMKKHCQE